MYIEEVDLLESKTPVPVLNDAGEGICSHLARWAENARANASPLLLASSVPPSLATAYRMNLYQDPMFNRHSTWLIHVKKQSKSLKSRFLCVTFTNKFSIGDSSGGEAETWFRICITFSTRSGICPDRTVNQYLYKNEDPYKFKK